MVIQYFYRIYPTSVTVPYRTVQYGMVRNGTVTKRYFSKIPLHLNVKFLTHHDMQHYIEKYTVTSIVALNCKGKDHRYTYRYRYYRYRKLKNKALRAPLQA